MTDLTILADHRELRQLRPWLDANASQLDPSLVGRIELCVHELAANVIDHSGSPELTLHLVGESSWLQIELRDRGNPVTTPIYDDLEPHPRVRGYGMMIAEQLASELSYERCESVNVWRVRFNLS